MMQIQTSAMIAPSPSWERVGVRVCRNTTPSPVRFASDLSHEGEVNLGAEVFNA